MCVLNNFLVKIFFQFGYELNLSYSLAQVPSLSTPVTELEPTYTFRGHRLVITKPYRNKSLETWYTRKLFF